MQPTTLKMKQIGPKNGVIRCEAEVSSNGFTAVEVSIDETKEVIATLSESTTGSHALIIIVENNLRTRNGQETKMQT